MRRGRQHRYMVSLLNANENMAPLLSGNSLPIFLITYRLQQLLILEFSAYMLAFLLPFKTFQT